jgi:hypothetical protein
MTEHEFVQSSAYPPFQHRNIIGTPLDESFPETTSVRHHSDHFEKQNERRLPQVTVRKVLVFIIWL